MLTRQRICAALHPSPRFRSASLLMESDVRFLSRRLPVPPLRQTLDKYLQSLDPFLRQDEDLGGPSRDVELSKRVKWASEFEQGLGAVLQNRLDSLDKVSPYNWLDDNFWMKTIYLQSRSSLMVNSNWWCIYQQDPSIPAFLEPENGHYSIWQVRRAAWLVHQMLQYRAQLENNAVRTVNSPEMPFQMPFYRCRIPGEGCDTLAQLPTRGSTSSRKIILMLRDRLYAIEVLNSADVAIPVADIESRIWSAISDVTSRQTRQHDLAPVGLLTTHDRDTWFKARTHLIEISQRNKAVLRAIEESIFVLSLDDYTLLPEGESTPIKDINLDAHVRNASTGIAGHNRWYDKCVSIFVESNARAGGMGEHSPCDGVVVGAMMDHSLRKNIDDSQFNVPAGNLEIPSIDTVTPLGWERLDWDVDSKIKDLCMDAERQAQSIRDNSDASMLRFDDYGSLWIKDIAKLSPDAFAQMAMQLAWYRTQGNFTATYETASTQMFTHGRTETIRSFSTESWRFVKAMTDPLCSANPTRTRLYRLKEAVVTHVARTRQAIKGQEFDRHLLGLRLLMEDGEESPLFRDPLFERSQTWKLSTSGSQGDYFLGTGFGSPLEDGYGVQYILGAEVLKFGIESKVSCQKTSTERFKVALRDSLRDMRTLVEEGLTIEPRNIRDHLESTDTARL